MRALRYLFSRRFRAPGEDFQTSLQGQAHKVKSVKYQRSFVWLSAGWAILFGALALTPGRHQVDPEQFTVGDKLVHLAAFALLAWLMEQTRAGETWLRWVFIGLLGASYGAVIEVVQARWVYGRSGQVADWVADLLGIGIGLALSVRWERHKESEAKQR